MTSTDLVTTKREKSNENLIPFKKGFDPRKGNGRGRATILNDPEFVDLFAKAVSDGINTKELSEIFDIDRRTAQNYKQDPRVKAAAVKYIEDRVLRVCRKVDSQIEARLMDPEKLDTETLLRIRKEFLGGVFRMQTQGGKNDPRTINEALNEIEENPEFAKELTELLEKQAAGSNGG